MTGAIIGLFMGIEGLKDYTKENQWIHWTAFAVTFVSIFPFEHTNNCNIWYLKKLITKLKQKALAIKVASCYISGFHHNDGLFH